MPKRPDRPVFGQPTLPGMETPAASASSKLPTKGPKPFWRTQRSWDAQHGLNYRKVVKKLMTEEAPQRVTRAARIATTTAQVNEHHRSLLSLSYLFGVLTGREHERSLQARDEEVRAKTRREMTEHHQAVAGATRAGSADTLETVRTVASAVNPANGNGRRGH